MTPVRKMRSRLAVDNLVMTGVLTLVVLSVVSVLVVSGAVRELFAPDGTTVKAIFSDTVQLTEGSAVRVNGVEQGKVEKIIVNPGGRSATVELNVHEESMPLYHDASASVRWKTLLGGSMVVTLDRGTPGAGELRSNTIPESRTDSQVELDEVITAMRGGARTGMRRMLAELPRVFRDDDAMSLALRTLADVSPPLARGVESVRGSHEGDLRRLVSRTARTVQALDTPADVTALVQGGATTVETTAGRAADLRATIERAAYAMPRVVSTLGRLDSTLSAVDPLVARLRGPAADVAPTLAALRPTVARADRLLQDAEPLLASLRPAASDLAAAARDGVPFLREIAPSLARMDEQILPDLARRSPVTGRSTYEMIGPAVAGLQGNFSLFDGEKFYVRFPANGGDRAFDTPPCRGFSADPGAPGDSPWGEGDAPMLRCQELMDAMERYFNWEPLPPGDGK